MNNKVWVVIDTDCGRESTFYGVFSTKEKSQKFIDENKKKRYMDRPYIEEFKLDEVK